MAQPKIPFGQIELWLYEAAAVLPAECRTVRPPSPDGRLVGSWQEFEEFVSVGEYELAWDALATLGAGTRVEPEFWQLLEQCASAMGLGAHAERARLLAGGPSR